MIILVMRRVCFLIKFWWRMKSLDIYIGMIRIFDHRNFNHRNFDRTSSDHRNFNHRNSKLLLSIVSILNSFPCGRWLAKSNDDGSTERLLVAELQEKQNYNNNEGNLNCFFSSWCSVDFIDKEIHWCDVPVSEFAISTSSSPQRRSPVLGRKSFESKFFSRRKPELKLYNLTIFVLALYQFYTTLPRGPVRINYLLTECEVCTKKYQTEVFLYRLSP